MSIKAENDSKIRTQEKPPAARKGLSNWLGHAASLSSVDTKHWDLVSRIIGRAVTPTRLSLVFLIACWLLLRFVYIRSGAQLDVTELINFASSVLLIVATLYVVLIIIKGISLAFASGHRRSLYLPWTLLIACLLAIWISFDGYMLAGRSVYVLAAGQDETALGYLADLLDNHKLIPAMPVVVGIFASVFPADMLPKIHVVNLPVIISVCIGFTIFGFYAYFWKFLPRHISAAIVLFGAVGAGLLIFYIATPSAQSSASHGKIIVRVLVAVLLTCVFLAVYREYWKKAAAKFLVVEPKNPKPAPQSEDWEGDGGLESMPDEQAPIEEQKLLLRIAHIDWRLVHLPPGPVEIGLWLFFGLVVISDALSV